jgi:hypothetical protein
MVESVILWLPSLILAIIVFVPFYTLSIFVSRVIRRSTCGRRENLAWSSDGCLDGQRSCSAS